MSRNEWETITDCPYSAKILILLYKREALKRSDLQSLIPGSPQTQKLALEFLQNLGYLVIEDIKIPHITSKITLTGKGARAARRFIAIEEDLPEDDVIQSTPPELRNKAIE